MLYKKYHRSYVSQFKKGVKFVCRGSNRYSRYTVERNPYYVYRDIRLTGIEYCLTLVFSDGIVNENLHVIQEISQELC